MKHSNLKKTIVLGLFALLLIAWTGIKVFDARKENNSSAKENKKDIEEYYGKIYQPEEGKDTTFADGKSAELLKTYYEVKDITITKEAKDGLADYIFYPEVVIDNGEIVNDWSLAIITLSVKNNREREDVLSVNTNQVKAMNGEECECFFEAVYIEPCPEGPEGKSLFRLNLEPNEEKEVQVYYTIMDQYLEDTYTLNYCINPAGLNSEQLPGPEDDPARFFANIDFKEFINQ